ncbi:hypothetical protein M595_2553 [Lyngbya aestuarii BL J]|uniref:Uncharacterized protein n=1 Tax=Lyngbya aestuarii BL J TaxID=1348334 RepID=U7QM86_9CYAN|nr:hypothetical protein M595_2553 [Lyngbya aestuarii BL J]
MYVFLATTDLNPLNTLTAFPTGDGEGLIQIGDQYTSRWNPPLQYGLLSLKGKQ